MKLRRLKSGLLAAAFGFAAPIGTFVEAAQAAIVLTHKTHNNNVSSHSFTSASVVTNAGDIVLLGISARFSSGADAVVVSGSVDGAFPGGQVYECPIAAGTTSKSALAWVKSVGGTQTFTVSEGSGAAVATSIEVSVEVLTGVDQTTPEDSAVRGTCANGTAANPVVTSGSAIRANELFYSNYMTPTISGYSPTLDGAWTASTAASGNAVMGWSPAYLINASTGTKTRTDTVTSRLYAEPMMGFNPPLVAGTTVCGLLTSDIGDC